MAPIALIALNAAMPYVAFSYPVGQTLLNLLIALVIHRVMLLRDSPTGRLLNHPVLVSFGAMSYSLYLWQQPFLNRASVSPFAAFPVNVALALAAALLSYQLVELPVRRLAARARTSRIGRHVEPAAGGLQSHGAAC